MDQKEHGEAQFYRFHLWFDPWRKWSLCIPTNYVERPQHSVAHSWKYKNVQIMMDHNVISDKHLPHALEILTWWLEPWQLELEEEIRWEEASKQHAHAVNGSR
jgi:hypothetical protein